MSLSMLVNGGAECGPSNPLQGLSKRFDQDRGIQQDQFVAGRAGPSNQTFRTQTSNAFSEDQDARRFFSSPHQIQQSQPGSFDLTPLAYALPTPSLVTSPLSPQTAAGPAPWAADFLTQHPQSHLQSHQASTASPSNFIPQHTQTRAESAVVGQATPFAPVFHGYRSAPVIASPIGVNSPPYFQTKQDDHTNHLKEADWEHAFSSLEAAAQQQPQQGPSQNGQQHDPDLARAAAMLLEQVKEETETNPKFKNSQFMELMRGLKTGEVVVEGNDMVKASEASSSDITRTAVPHPPPLSADVKGKGRMGDTSFQEHAQGYLSALERNDLRSEQEVDIDRYFEQDNEEYIALNERYHGHPSRFHKADNITGDWGLLHDQWERFEATASGIKEIPIYQFQTNNPYLNSGRTMHHSMHSLDPLYDSVLEREAAVQNDPTNAQAWFELGVKQQENEQEIKALIALQRAVDADRNHLPSWLALAVSYTNESDRQGAYKAIHEWVIKLRQPEYMDAITNYRAKHRETGLSEHYAELMECLLSMARSNTTGEVDADVQIALAVLLNGNEEYEKAQDCFRSALSVRPFDWLLYNRVGATLANSGRAEEALGYYARALELNPGYIRARFNMGISCINLRRYEEAIQHITDALSLQESDRVPDASGMNDTRGVVSAALWDSLKTACLHMQRLDLANHCDRRDLEGFRVGFYGEI